MKNEQIMIEQWDILFGNRYKFLCNIIGCNHRLNSRTTSRDHELFYCCYTNDFFSSIFA